VTLPTDPHDVDAVHPAWWWEAATTGARKSGTHLQDAVTLALRQRAPRIVEVIRVEHDHGLAAVTADTLIIAVNRGRETRTTEVPAGQITAVLRKQANVINIKCGNVDIELRVPGDQLEAAIIGLRAQTSTTRPDGPRHIVAPPSRRLAAPQRVSDPGERPDRRAPLEARRQAAPIGMGSRRAQAPADPPEPARVPPPAPADSSTPPSAAARKDAAARPSPAAPRPNPASAAGRDYVRCSDGVWRRPPVTPPLAPASEGEDERLQ
jgi:hypothetical protein